MLRNERRCYSLRACYTERCHNLHETHAFLAQANALAVDACKIVVVFQSWSPPSVLSKLFFVQDQRNCMFFWLQTFRRHSFLVSSNLSSRQLGFHFGFRRFHGLHLLLVQPLIFLLSFQLLLSLLFLSILDKKAKKYTNDDYKQHLVCVKQLKLRATAAARARLRCLLV